jgi:hypothetical protein
MQLGVQIGRYVEDYIPASLNVNSWMPQAGFTPSLEKVLSLAINLLRARWCVWATRQDRRVAACGSECVIGEQRQARTEGKQQIFTVSGNGRLHSSHRDRLREVQRAAVIQCHAIRRVARILQSGEVAHQDSGIRLQVYSVPFVILRRQGRGPRISGEVRVIENRHARFAFKVHAVLSVADHLHL